MAVACSVVAAGLEDYYAYCDSPANRAPGDTAEAKVRHWIGRDDPSLRFTLSMLTEIAAQKTLDYPTASVAVQRLSQLAQRG